MTDTGYSLLCDFYSLTMTNALVESGQGEEYVYFDVFFRRVPDKGGYAVFAGLEDIIEFVKNIHFSSDDLNFLRSKGIFGEKFLSFLADFSFSGNILSVPEGSVVFPKEPIMIIHGKIQELLLLEAYILQTVNHQSLIATKTSRMVIACNGRLLAEMGARRAHGESASLKGARSAYIAGAAATSNTLAAKKYGIPLFGSMSHAWVQLFDCEEEAFSAFCKVYPHSPTLLIDTYDTLNSGIHAAVKVIKDLKVKNPAVRIDSGDIAYLTKNVRKILDNAGLFDCKIAVSNALDEHLIKELINQEAKIDIFGVGENLITAKSHAVFGAVYKLTARKNKNGDIVPVIKLSENREKITTPHFKCVYRFYDKSTGKALADEITLFDEEINENTPRTIFDEEQVWKKKTLSNFNVKKLLVPIFTNGKCVYTSPDLQDIRLYREKEVGRLWEEIKRFDNPHKYYVDLSERLWEVKRQLSYIRLSASGIASQ